MYAIIENGGKQYKAIEGSYVEIDLLPEDVGNKKTFDKVLLLSTDEKVEVGTPYIKGVSVDATIISHFKGPKLIVFKYRPKQRFRVKTGHRQRYSRVLVDSIAFPGKSATTKKASELKAEPVAKKSTAAVKKTTTAAKKPASKTIAAKKTTTVDKKPAAKSSTTKKTTTAAKKPAAKATTAKKTTTAAKKPAAKSSTTKKTTAAKKTSSADEK